MLYPFKSHQISTTDNPFKSQPRTGHTREPDPNIYVVSGRTMVLHYVRPHISFLLVTPAGFEPRTSRTSRPGPRPARPSRAPTAERPAPRACATRLAVLRVCCWDWRCGDSTWNLCGCVVYSTFLNGNARRIRTRNHPHLSARPPPRAPLVGSHCMPMASLIAC